MKFIQQLISAVTLSIFASTAVAQDPTISGNLVPLPNHWTTNGQTVNQTYAINQALSAAGAGVIIHGFDYGYQYNLGSSWTQCTWVNNGVCVQTQTFNPRVDVNVSIRDNDNTQIYGITHIETGVNTGNQRRDFQYRFDNSRDILTLGNFNFSASTSQNATVFGMYSRAVYTADPCVANPQSSPSCQGFKTFYTITDDQYAIIPFPQGFTFPFYGQIFTHSIMFDNGVVSFYSPNHSQRLGGTNWGASTITNNISSQFHYSIMPLWGDLAPNSNTRFFTQTDSSSFFKYTWENIQQWGRSDRLNTFSLEVRPTGFFGINYEKINLGDYPVTVGYLGNALLGEWNQIYRQGSGGFTNLQSVNNWSVNSTPAFDCSDPQTSNQFCGAGTVAYTNWQISQCTNNPLSFSGLCETLTPTIWFNYKCSESALYDPNCLGYAAAFLTQQCNNNTLYSPSCPGYDLAYAQWQVSQCTANILAFGGQCATITPTAWFNYQCGLDPLYNKDCDGFADALYVKNCTADPLFDKGCTGYAEAYALKYIVNADTTTLTDSTTTIAVVDESTVVDIKVEEKATVAATETREAAVSASPAAQATAPVSLAAAPAANSATTSRTETRTDAPRTTAPARAAPTTRQAVAEQRMAAAREQAAQAARENPGETTAAMDSATSLEQQVEVQNVVLGAMSFVPGFDAYGRATIPDAAGYPPFVIYPGQRNIDSPAARGLLGRSDRLHQEMVDAQYR